MPKLLGKDPTTHRRILWINNGTEEMTDKLKDSSDPYYISLPLRDREVGKTMKYIENQDLGPC